MILVTGGAGYVGSVLVDGLLRLGERVRVVDLQWFGDPFAAQPRLELVRGDVNNWEDGWLDDVDAVCHLAGLSNDPTSDFMPELALESNVQATRTLANAMARRAARLEREMRLVFASSCSVYYSGAADANWNVERMTEETPVAPSSTYSKTKRLAEIELLRVAQENPLFCPVLLRKGTIFGLSPRMRFDLVVNAFTLHAWTRRTLTVNGSGEAWRPLTHIQDAADAYVYMLSAPSSSIRGEIFNVLHKNYRVLELAHWVAEVLEQQRGVEIRVRRDRSSGDGGRSYWVDGEKILRSLGFRSDRGAATAVLGLWDALEAGRFGEAPQEDCQYFNIRRLQRDQAAPGRGRGAMTKAEIKDLALRGVRVVRFRRHADARGYFVETFQRTGFGREPLEALFEGAAFVQCNESYSRAGTVRGLHFQWDPPMGKLVRTVHGRMVDLVLDIRLDSPTFGEIIAYDMPEDREYLEWIWVPPGFAHGNFFSADSRIEYMCTGEYNASGEAGISPLAPDLNWGRCDPALKRAFDETAGRTELITDKDRNGMSLEAWRNDPRSANFVCSGARA